MNITTIQKPDCINTPSFNFNDRPEGMLIKYIILHYTDLFTCDESIAILTDPFSQVSCHYLIDQTGDIFQLVDDEKRAWHAGISRWQDDDNINDTSIGIELQNGGMKYKEKYGEWEVYPQAQLSALVKLASYLMRTYDIPLKNILGHNQIAPLRKIDPGPHFKWHTFHKMLNDEIT